VGLTTGVDITSPGVKSGVVVEDVVAAAAIRLEARSDGWRSWRRERFPNDVEPLTEREGAKGADKTGVSTVGCVLVVASDITVSWSDWRKNAFRTRRKGMRRRGMTMTMMMMMVVI
jgi:hypothetical protein